jgi:phosphoribosylamine---glycine ligase
MHVLIIGSGGREHAVATSLKNSPKVSRLTCAPANAGIAQLCDTVDLQAKDVDGIVKWCQENQVDLCVATPEDPLALGLVDRLAEVGIAAFGPGAAATRIESSKAFAKNLMARKGVATARFAVFEDAASAADFAHKMDAEGKRVVVKASGLALGKGAIVADDLLEALDAIDTTMVKKAFGEAGDTIVVEERMVGEEVSVFALCDGENFKTMLPSQDHKPVGDGDIGPNTGGMGAYCPAPVADAAMMQRIEEEVFAPVLEGLKEEGCPYRGLLYAGLMICDGNPYVIEFNARFGDPETQAVLPLLENDLLELLLACCHGSIAEHELKWKSGAATCVVMASGGYPDSYEKGKVINGLDSDFGQGVFVFHAGTRQEGDTIVTNGGRVLGVTSLGGDILESTARAYEACSGIDFERKYLRGDIAFRALQREA